jgi:hypothetical protein
MVSCLHDNAGWTRLHPRIADATLQYLATPINTFNRVNR